MKLGVIGLGDIAKKAYLPVLSLKKGIELHLFTRNKETLQTLGSQYRISNLHKSINLLIDSGIQGAFVHVATSAHYEIVRQLLEQGIHVYVDKPITDSFDTTKSLIDLAKKKNLILMAGFNRRYAPVYQNLKEVSDCNMVIMQKNRNALPGEVRNFIFDDFIHVVDTLLYLFPFSVDELNVQGKMVENQLHHVVVQFIFGTGATAIGIMNRNSGTTEEKVEVFSATEKRIAYDVSEIEILKDNKKTFIKRNDWEPTLTKRGFTQITDDFLNAIKSNISPRITSEEILRTHEICERIVTSLSQNNIGLISI